MPVLANLITRLRKKLKMSKLNVPQRKQKEDGPAEEGGETKSLLAQINPFDVMILILSVYVLIALFIEVTFDLSEDIKNILMAIDNVICIIFLADFFVRLSRAENKLQFLKWGWIDFISSIPMLDAFRYGRLVRVIRILRILRTVRSIRIIAPFIFRHRAKSSFATVTLLAVLLILSASIMILSFDRDERGETDT